MCEYAKIDITTQGPGTIGIVDTLTRDENNAAKLLIKNLNVDFSSSNFENPTL